MAKNICPRCHEVILTLQQENTIECVKCDTVFESANDTDEGN